MIIAEAEAVNNNHEIARKYGTLVSPGINGPLMEKPPQKVIFEGVRQLRIEVPRKMEVSVHKKA